MNTKDIEEKLIAKLQKESKGKTTPDFTFRESLIEWAVKETIKELTQHHEAEMEKAVEAERKKCDIRVRKEAEALTKKKIAHGQAMYEKGKKERD